MAVYLIHSANHRHYIGYADDVESRVREHRETTWVRYGEPIILPDGRKKNGETHGIGATFLGALNSQGVSWDVVRVWDEATRKFERWLKNKKSAPRYCPICSPNNKRLQNVQVY